MLVEQRKALGIDERLLNLSKPEEVVKHSFLNDINPEMTGVERNQAEKKK